MHPEQEFHKVALEACSSTIVQQEADIKTLKESLDIRNKKILQLEGQVGVAKSYSQEETTLKWTVALPQSNSINSQK